MNKHKTILGLILFVVGLLGVFSLLTMDIPLPPEAEELLNSKFSPLQIKLLTLGNPLIMLFIAVILGVNLRGNLDLNVPIIEKLIGKTTNEIQVGEIVKFGIIGGIISGVLIGLVSLVFSPVLPAEIIELGEKLKPSVAVRFLYGGLTEEILMRFGFMTFIVWLFSKMVKEENTTIY